MLNKIMKSLFVLFLITVALIASPKKIYAEPQTETEFHEYVKSLGYKVETDNGLMVNFETYQEYELIVWGDPFGRYKYGSMCGRGSEYEFLGYQEDGESQVHNKCFPNDVDSGVHPKYWDFVKVPGAVKSWETLTESQINHLLNNPLLGHGADEDDMLTIEDIGGIEYAKVEVPPTWFGKASIYTENNGVK